MDAMNFYSEEDAEYEFNSQFDYAREAYAASELDPWHEAYCDYCFECQEYGDDPLDFADWKREQMKPSLPVPPVDYPEYSGEIPF